MSFPRLRHSINKLQLHSYMHSCPLCSFLFCSASFSAHISSFACRRGKSSSFGFARYVDVLSVCLSIYIHVCIYISMYVRMSEFIYCMDTTVWFPKQLHPWIYIISYSYCRLHGRNGRAFPHVCIYDIWIPILNVWPLWFTCLPPSRAAHQWYFCPPMRIRVYWCVWRL